MEPTRGPYADAKHSNGSVFAVFWGHFWNFLRGCILEGHKITEATRGTKSLNTVMNVQGPPVKAFSILASASAIVPRLRNLPLRAVAACCLLLLALPLASYKLLLATCHLPLLLPACYLLLAACCLQLAVLHCARWYDPTEWAFASSIYIYIYKFGVDNSRGHF